MVATPQQSTFAAVLISVAAVSGFLLLPLLVAAVAEPFALGERAGSIGSLVMAGFAVAALASLVWLGRANWRRAGRWLLAVKAASWLLVLIAVAQQWLWLALAAIAVGAVAGGSAYALALSALAQGQQAARGFSYSVAGQVGFQVVALAVCGQLAGRYGIAGLALPLALCSGVALLTASWLPVQSLQAQPEPGTAPLAAGWYAPRILLALLGGALFYLNIGAYWSYLKLFGSSAGIAAEQLTAVLAYGVASGLLGALLAAWLAERLAAATALWLAALGSGAAVSLLLLPASPWLLFASLALYKFCWNFSLPFQYAAVTSLDPSGRGVALTPAFHGGGGALGPLLVALLSGQLGYTAVVLVALAALAGSALLFAVALARRR